MTNIPNIEASELLYKPDLVRQYRQGLLDGYKNQVFSLPYIHAKWQYTKGRVPSAWQSWFTMAENEISFPTDWLDNDLVNYIFSRLMENPRCCAYESATALSQQRLAKLQAPLKVTPMPVPQPADLVLRPAIPLDVEEAVVLPAQPKVAQQPQTTSFWSMLTTAIKQNIGDRIQTAPAKAQTAPATAPETGNYTDADVAATTNAANTGTLTQPDAARTVAVDPNTVDINKLPVPNKANAQAQVDQAKLNRQFIYLTPNIARYVSFSYTPWSKIVLASVGLLGLGALAYFMFLRKRD